MLVLGLVPRQAYTDGSGWPSSTISASLFLELAIASPSSSFLDLAEDVSPFTRHRMLDEALEQFQESQKLGFFVFVQICSEQMPFGRSLRAEQVIQPFDGSAREEVLAL